MGSLDKTSLDKYGSSQVVVNNGLEGTMSFSSMKALPSPVENHTVWVKDTKLSTSLWAYKVYKPDGTKGWRPANGIATIISIPFNNVPAPAASTEQQLDVFTIPAGMFAEGLQLKYHLTIDKKDKVSDSLTFYIKIGNSGTSSDTQMLNYTALATTVDYGGAINSFYRRNATTISRSGGAGAANSDQRGVSNATNAPEATVTDLDTTDLKIYLGYKWTVGTAEDFNYKIVFWFEG